jgi:hypothetical protein
MQNQAPDLSQLKDIHLPNVITAWPTSFGWWTLLTVIIVLTLAGLYFRNQERKKNANKRAALILLDNQYAQFKANNNAQTFLQQSNQILKRYCLDKYPEAVSLSGPAWTDFLIRHSHKTFFNAELANAISQGLYQAHCQFDAQALYLACGSWLKNNKPAVVKKSFIDNDTLKKDILAQDTIKKDIGNTGSSND